MSTMKSVYALAVLFLVVTLSDADIDDGTVDCGYYCAISLCLALTEDNCNGTIVRNGGYCGCCDLCQETVPKDKACSHRT